MTNVVGFKGEDVSVLPGTPRHDICELLERIAERAARGEISALVLAAYVHGNDSVITGVCTPENAYYSMLGATVELQDQIKARSPEDTSFKGINNDD